MQFLFKILDSNDKTKLNTDSISCDKYKFNSCPKEFIDFLSPIYAAAIRKIEQGTTSFTRSVLSDFQDKARTNGIQQAIIHTVLSAILIVSFSLALFSFMKYGAFLPDGTTNTPMSLLVALGVFGYLTAVVFFHFYWYGQIAGMDADESTAFIIKWIIPSFLRWYISISFLAFFFILIFLNIPGGFVSIISAMTNNIVQHESVWRAFLDNTFLPDFETVKKFHEALATSDLKFFSMVSNGLFMAAVGLIILLAKIGYTKGRYHTELMTIEEKQIVKRKLEYKFDKAIRLLEESGL